MTGPSSIQGFYRYSANCKIKSIILMGKMTPITVKAITLDLDDTLWPIWPTIQRAEQHLYNWMSQRAPATAAATSLEGLRALRQQVETAHPQWKHDLSAYRREAIRLALRQAGDDESLTEEGFSVFFEARQQVDLFDDALPALERLSARYPLIALSNGNSDLQRMGLKHYFQAAVSAQNFGISKPDKRIFHEAARVSGQNAADILHVGDDLQLDVSGALQAGMQTAWVVRGPAQQNTGSQDVQPQYTVTDLLQLCDALGC